MTLLAMKWFRAGQEQRPAAFQFFQRRIALRQQFFHGPEIARITDQCLVLRVICLKREIDEWFFSEIHFWGLSRGSFLGRAAVLVGFHQALLQPLHG